jgi:hypothetical protein
MILAVAPPRACDVGVVAHSLVGGPRVTRSPLLLLGAAVILALLGAAFALGWLREVLLVAAAGVLLVLLADFAAGRARGA